jgi:Tol biopolymer transport system component
MKWIKYSFNNFANFTLLVLLLIGMVILFSFVSGKNNLAAQTPQPIDTLHPYPPPQATDIPPMITPVPPTQIFIETTPGEFMPPSSTPYPTFTPFPSPTQSKGPTATPIPVIPPAADASGRIIFLASQPEGKYSLYSLTTDAQGIAGKQFPISQENLQLPDLSMSYSPDGKRLVAIGDWGSLAIIDLENGISLPVSIPYYEKFRNWYSDSRQVIILANHRELWLSDPFTGEHVVLSATGYGTIDAAAASPDGRIIIYSTRSGPETYNGIWRVGADGRDSKRLIESPANALHFSWSPDGQLVAYISRSLTVMDKDGSVLLKMDDIYPPACYRSSPAWSPDSLYLAVVVSDGQADFCGGLNKSTLDGANILIVEISTGKNWPLLLDGSLGNIDPAWSPDGKQIAFVSNRKGTQAVWVVNVDGNNLRQISEGDLTYYLPMWRSVK